MVNDVDTRNNSLKKHNSKTFTCNRLSFFVYVWSFYFPRVYQFCMSCYHCCFAFLCTRLWLFVFWRARHCRNIQYYSQDTFYFLFRWALFMIYDTKINNDCHFASSCLQVMVCFLHVLHVIPFLKRLLSAVCFVCARLLEVQTKLICAHNYNEAM